MENDVHSHFSEGTTKPFWTSRPQTRVKETDKIMFLSSLRLCSDMVTVKLIV